MSQHVAAGQVKEVAARIGLAARSLGGCDLARLIEGLLTEMGSPLTTDKLNRVTVATLVKIFEHDRDALLGSLMAIHHELLSRPLRPLGAPAELSDEEIVQRLREEPQYRPSQHGGMRAGGNPTPENHDA